jgi:hypothetical protein
MAAVEYVFRVTGLPQAEQGLDAVAGAARGGAAALDALGQSATPAGNAIAGSMTEAQRATAQAEAALERLLYAQASGSQRAVMDLQKQVAGLDALAAAGADAATVERARALAAQQGAARIANALDIERGKAGQLAVDLDGLDVASRRSSQGLSSIAMQMPDVIAGLASGQSAVTVFMQQGLQVFQQNLSSLLPLLASVGPALAVVGTAAAALGGVYLYLADSVEEAEEAMARSAAAATAMQDAHGQLGDVMLSLSDEVGLLTGAIDREAIAQRRRDQTIREGFGVVEEQLRLKEQSLALELAGVEAALKSGDVTKANVLAQQRLTEQLAAYEKTREQIESRRDRALADSELVAFGQRSLREAGAAGAGRTVRATAAPAAEPPPVIVDMAALSREMQSFAVFTGGDLGPLSDALAESAEGFERASRALARARSPEELAAAAERAATASAAVGIAGSVARGNLGGAVTGLGSMLGPSAAALGPIGAAIGVAQGIGATAEAQGVSVADVTTQAVEGAVGALVAVVEGLPDIIAQTIPVLVSALAVELPIALVAALPDVLAAALYTALIGLPKAIAEAIRDAITPGTEGGQTTTAGAVGRIARGGVTGDVDAQDVPTLIAAVLLARGRDRSRATSSRSATTARRAATTRPSPAAAPNPFRAFADAYDGQFAGPFGASPTTPQLRGT